ncbi:protease modulator HflK N-terminal domain-containing protein, partial [Agrobacterium sp. S2]|nr:protease modulator HflK N-terminal domain-containing protein [Agrobacterium sp. S2]
MAAAAHGAAAVEETTRVAVAARGGRGLTGLAAVAAAMAVPPDLEEIIRRSQDRFK